MAQLAFLQKKRYDTYQGYFKSPSNRNGSICRVDTR
jgi:hypothetical protein